MNIPMMPSLANTNALERQLAKWSEGIDYELEFWERWHATKGDQWPEDFRQRQRIDVDNPEWLLRCLGIEADPYAARILDVGAGPLTVLASHHKGLRLNVTAVDPLAPFYADMARRHGVARPVETRQGFAEDLTAIFDLDFFDAVHCCNALDHSFDPIRGIDEMLMVCRVGGTVCLRHNRNEAEAEQYSGFHQWNFDGRDGSFVVWNKEQEIDATVRFSPQAEVNTAINGNGVVVTFRKKRATSVDLAQRYRARASELLAAFLSSSISVYRGDGIQG